MKRNIKKLVVEKYDFQFLAHPLENLWFRLNMFFLNKLKISQVEKVLAFLQRRMLLHRKEEIPKVMSFVDKWFSTPDSKGEKYWDDFENEVNEDRLSLRSSGKD